MPESSQREWAAPGFASAEGLRALLNRLHERDSWRTDPEVGELLAFVRARYVRLARKWDRDPDDAVTAAFEAMRGEGTRHGDDPWAVVTTAVARALKADAHADWLMIDPDKARRPAAVVHERPLRASANEDFLDALASPDPETGREDVGRMAQTLTGILVGLDWPEQVAEGCVDYVLDRLMRVGRRETAIDALRRDITLLALYQLPRSSWLTLLRVLLGPAGQPGTVVRHGMIARLLLEESADDLLADDDVVLALYEAAPRSGRLS